MKKCIFWIIAVALFLSPFGLLKADDPAGLKRLDGQIAALDWVSSSLIVKIVYPGTLDYDETKFAVSNDATITKGPETISFMDLNVGDLVVVQYYDKGLAGLKAFSIMVKV